MKEEAQKQLAPVSNAQIREILKQAVPAAFDKMIITDEQATTRCNYIFIKCKYQTADRKLKKIRFPLYSSLTTAFAELEGGKAKFGERARINSNQIFDILKKEYDVRSSELDATGQDDLFNFPFDISGNEINPQQYKYFIADQTYQATCENCKGGKYVTCSNEECGGRHEYTCPKCHGNRKMDCEICNKTGFTRCDKCKGSGEYKCSNCQGTGQIKCESSHGGCGGRGYKQIGNNRQNCVKCNGRGYTPCTECRDGMKRCEKCMAKGEVRCGECSGRGEVDCNHCNAAGRVTCKICYGDKERYGKIDCPDCKTAGTMAQIVFIESDIAEDEKEKIFWKENNLDIPEKNIRNHVTVQPLVEVVYKNVNGDIIQQYDDYSKIYAPEFEGELRLNKDGFPLLTKEEIYYQVIPCIELEYSHVLLNTLHKLTIIDFWNSPEVTFHDEPEKLSSGLGEVSKKVGSFFGRLFKTNKFRTKEDKKNEILLFIHLIKADGKIEEQEKKHLFDFIGSLDELTNNEKSDLLEVLNATTLPELTEEDVRFSSKERAKEVLDRLKIIAEADGEIHETEKALIEKVASMM